MNNHNRTESILRRTRKTAALSFRLGLLLIPCFIVLAEAPPDPPLVATPQAPIAWMITVKQKNPRPAPPADPKWQEAFKRMLEIHPRVAKVAVEKEGENELRQTVYENGKQDIMYIYDDWVVYRVFDWPEGKALALPVHFNNSPVKDGRGPDFPDLVWIRKEAFVRTESYEGHNCYYYEDKNAGPLPYDDKLSRAQSGGAHAWIDVKSRLPVAVEDGSVLEKYSYSAGAQKIQLSGIFATAYQNAVEAAKN